MILTIDIGNSNITIGAYRGNELLFLTRMGTDRTKMPDEYAIAIHSLLRLYGYHGSDLEGAIISSVVPPLSASLKQAITRIKPVRILTVGPGIKTGLHIAIDNPAQLGADLACVSVAALEKYPLPSIVIDMGTATTISAMDRDGKMLGGVLYGTASMLDGMIDRYKAELGEDLTVIATGGLSKSIAVLCRNDIVLDENLVLEGLRILFQKNTK